MLKILFGDLVTIWSTSESVTSYFICNLVNKVNIYRHLLVIISCDILRFYVRFGKFSTILFTPVLKTLWIIPRIIFILFTMYVQKGGRCKEKRTFLSKSKIGFFHLIISHHFCWMQQRKLWKYILKVTVHLVCAHQTRVNNRFRDIICTWCTGCF